MEILSVGECLTLSAGFGFVRMWFCLDRGWVLRYAPDGYLLRHKPICLEWCTHPLFWSFLGRI